MITEFSYPGRSRELLIALANKYTRLNYPVYSMTELVLDTDSLRGEFPMAKGETFWAMYEAMEQAGLIKQYTLVEGKEYIYFTYQAWQEACRLAS